MIQLTHEISEDGTHLRLLADAAAQAELRELRDDDTDNWGSTKCETEVMDYLLANSALRWVDPSDTGDLTDAPLLGICGETTDKPEGPYGCVHVGFWGDATRYEPIDQKWGYAPYALRSFLDDLADDGVAIFSNNW